MHKQSFKALEENKIQRVGSQKDIPVNVRVIAATNKDLKKEIEKVILEKRYQISSHSN